MSLKDDQKRVWGSWDQKRNLPTHPPYMKKEEEVPLHDASAYFSKEEWKLLHEWQKELYSNVMKEIHQALISLGPLITSTVFSLRAKENEEPCPVDSQEPERKHSIDFSLSDRIANPQVFRINTGDHLHLNDPEDVEGSDENGMLSDDEEEGYPVINSNVSLRTKDEPVSIFIDHLGVEVIESSSDRPMGPDFASFNIKDEAETFSIDHENSRKIENLCNPTGGGRMSRQNKNGESKQCAKKSAPFKASSENKNTNMFLTSRRRTNSGTHMWSEKYQEIREAKPTEFESGSSSSTYPGRSRGRMPKTYNECESNVRTSEFVDGPQTEQNLETYTGTELENRYILMSEYLRHTGAHSSSRPYACTVCDKSFFRKGHLITHYRTHTGEKPYTCPFCPKRFNRKDNMNGHIRIHTGEKPYRCVECEKNFTSKSDLNQHRKRRHEPMEHGPLYQKAGSDINVMHYESTLEDTNCTDMQ